MSDGERGPTRQPIRPDADRLWAELEGATEGPRGRGRDQEVISQSERPSSRTAAADRANAARELYEATAALIRENSAIEILDQLADPAESTRTLTLRRSGAGDRELTLEFDLKTGSVTEHRPDGSVRTIDPFDEGDPASGREAIRASLSWLEGSSQ